MIEQNMDENAPSPPSLKTRPSLWFWISGVSVVLSYLIWLVLLLFVLTAFEEMYADLGAKLPKITQILFDSASFIKSNFLSTQLSILSLMALTIWGLYVLDQQKHIFAVVVIGNIPPAIVIIMILSMFLPIFQLTTLLGD
ncbi:MAG: hypothetical protein AAF065_00395 [Verrucomicrobiota bacterium]